MRVRFREIEKESLEIRVPIAFATWLRTTAAAERRSISEVGSEVLARGLEIDPRTIGIEPTPATTR